MNPLIERMDRIEAKLDALTLLMKSPPKERSSYLVEEVAKILGTTPNTVRIWCRHGRIEASRRSETRGGIELWNVTADEITRYQDEGLLPLDPRRNEKKAVHARTVKKPTRLHD